MTLLHFLCLSPTTTRAFASNRSKRGIYAGKDIRFGNNISFSHRKTRRTFKPNAQRKRLWSETLGCWLRFNLAPNFTLYVGRPVYRDQAGGIDARRCRKTPDANASWEHRRAPMEKDAIPSLFT